MNRIPYAWGTLILLLLTACQQHFISDTNERQEARHFFEERQNALQHTDIFQVFSETMTAREQEAMQFMYAYMPLGDLTDYSGDFHLQQVRAALKAQEEMPWGKDIPEREFRHFVLPYRVNNENLDSARTVFYRELQPRLQHLTLREAVLEINHWCHEKVAYTPSDMRTSAPLASVRTAYGRCGEESTFAVAAFRAMCIPARQVYTPRWAHTNDNHAWVEVWVDGQWHFLGACEPEPVLDLAWFNAPASRGMLMHTKVFGHYYGPEEVMEMNDNYTEINVISNYADTATATVTVRDTEGHPVEGAVVEFKLYNYAEFYTVARKTTDREGKVTQTAGLGDMLVWASADGRFGYRKCSFGKDRELVLTLDQSAGQLQTDIDLDIVPPAEKPRIPEVTPEQRAENDRRFAYEDSVRHAYIATFPTEEDSRAFAEAHGLDARLVVPLLTRSRGNYATLQSFLADVSPDEASTAIRLLQMLSEKDLRDVEPAALDEHFRLRVKDSDCAPAIYDPYLLNPRIANEMLLPYKEVIRQAFTEEEAEAIRQQPSLLADWCREHVQLHNEWNPQRIPLSPAGVCRARVADDYSLQIFYVAAARSLGVPARIDEVTGKVQYFEGERPVDVDLTGESQATTARQGTLKAAYTPSSWLDDPKYYNHFTLSKLEGGSLRLLNYPENGTSWKSLLKEGTPLDEGTYALVTGTRMANGSVLAHLKFFTIRPDEECLVDLTMRESKDEVQVIGNFNSENLYLPAQGGAAVSLLSTTGRGYYVVGLLGVGQEPTNHALRDIAALKEDFEKWGRSLIFLCPDKQELNKLRLSDFPPLPSTVTWGTDPDGKIRAEIIREMKLDASKGLPIFLVADTFNRVVFVSQGYTIGLGEQLMKTIHKL